MLAATEAPAWVTYVALATGGLGAVTGVISLWFSYANYRTSGHQISVDAFRLHVNRDEDDFALLREDHHSITIRNSGRSPVDLEALLVQRVESFWYEVKRRSYRSQLKRMFFKLYPRTIGEGEIKEGPALPFRVEGNQSQHWEVDAEKMREMASHDEREIVLCFGVRLGNGRVVYSRQTMAID